MEIFMPWLSFIADVVGVLGAVFALLAWTQAQRLQQNFEREQQRQQKKVTIVLAHGPEQYELPIQLQRAELTRSEVMGVLGMIPMKERGKRFSIGFVSTKDFLDKINEIIKSDGDQRLLIPCQKVEYEQFDFVAFRKHVRI